MTGYHIRTAVPADGPHLALISQSVAFRPETADPNQGFLVFQGTPDEYSFRLAACPDSVVAVGEDDVPVAFLLATPGETIAEWAKRGWLAPGEQTAHVLRHEPAVYLLVDQIGVSPHARREGLAQRMLDAVVVAAGRTVVGASIMHAPFRNLRSLRFFTEKNGFSLVMCYSEPEFEWGYYERKY
ncbi:MAG TPA: GNAT family N-acetyltransferase [Bryobacteraceae bacterium]|nr:GNAT family N-acetyltransferase [Bryobacteraceae bacterium]